jgi:hypothetical protein
MHLHMHIMSEAYSLSHVKDPGVNGEPVARAAGGVFRLGPGNG